MAAITLDIRNAFNECDRAKMMEAAYNDHEMSRAWKLIDYSYSAPTLLWINDSSGHVQSLDELQSKQGVRQGNPLSPLLFSLAWDRYVMKPVTDDFKYDDVTVSSYHDDTTIVAPVDIIFDVYDTIVQYAAEVSLHIQQSKCAFMYLHDDVHRPSQEVLSKIESYCIPRCEALTVVGVPIGKVDINYNQIIQKRLDGLHTIFSRLKHHKLGKQRAFLLLRSCAQRQMDFLLWAVSPSAVNSFAGQFDEMVLDSAMDILELHEIRSSSLPLEELALAQMFHSLSLGGLGLRRTQYLSPIAFLSAHIAAIRERPAIWQDISNRCPSSYRRLLDEVGKCMDIVRARAVTADYGDPETLDFDLQQQTLLDKLLPAPALTRPLQYRTLRHFYKKDGRDTTMDHLQTALTRLGSKSTFYAFRHPQSTSIQNLSQPLREGHRAHMTSLTIPHAGRWLSAIPRDETTVMPDEQFTCAVRIRLYLPARSTMTEHCCCEMFTNEPGAYLIDPIHALSCIRTRGREITERHRLCCGGDGGGVQTLRCDCTPSRRAAMTMTLTSDLTSAASDQW